MFRVDWFIVSQPIGKVRTDVTAVVNTQLLFLVRDMLISYKNMV